MNKLTIEYEYKHKIEINIKKEKEIKKVEKKVSNVLDYRLSAMKKNRP